MIPTDDVERIVDRIRSATAEVTHTAAAADLSTDRRNTCASRRHVVGFAAAAILLTGVALSLLVANNHETPSKVGSNVDTPPPSPSVAPANIETTHERVEIMITSDLQCANKIDTTGTFTQLTVETWIDRANHRARTTMTYPDGSTQDIIAFGDGIYPTKMYQSGMGRIARPGCIASDGEPVVLSLGPPDGSVYLLNLQDLLTEQQAEQFNSYDKVATRQPGQIPDSRGRTTEMWTQEVQGTATFGTETAAIEQTTQTYVTPGTHRITERVTTNTYNAIGTATVTETLTDDTTVTVPTSFFDVAGYTITKLQPNEPATPPPCVTEPFAPSTLPDGTDAGTARIETSGIFGPSAAIWGQPGKVQVIETLHLSQDSTNFFASVAAGNALSAGPWLAILSSLDEANGVTVVELYNSTDGCLRHYQIQPGVTIATTTHYVQQWIEQLDPS